MSKGITVWSYTPLNGGESNGNVSPAETDTLFSGHGTTELEGSWGILYEFNRAITTVGHAITVPYGYDRPWNHHVVGVGVGHDDAEFCESRKSYAAYLENGESHDGKWWESDHYLFGSKKHYDPARTYKPGPFANWNHAFLRHCLDNARFRANEARKAGNWDDVKRYETRAYNIANELRYRQQTGKMESGK